MKRDVGANGNKSRRERKPRRTDGGQRIVRPRTAGALAALQWFEKLGLASEKPWYVEIAMDIVNRPAMATYSGDLDTRFHVNVYPEEWGVFFCHENRMSWVRVTDQPFVHGRDDHQLLTQLPALDDIGLLIAELEAKHRIAFQRHHALVHTNITAGKSALRKWLSSL